MPCEFEVDVLIGGNRYQYGFALNKSQIIEEWLFAYPNGKHQIWFERRNGTEGWHFGFALKGEKRKLTQLTRDDVLFLSVAGKFNPQLTPLYDWFAHFLQIVEPDTQQQDFLEFVTAWQQPEQQRLFEQLITLLSQADMGIVDVKVEMQPLQDEIPTGLPAGVKTALENLATVVNQLHPKQMATVPQPFFVHQTVSGRYALPLLDESAGTRRLFVLGWLVLQALQKGGVLIIDELDSSLHPILAREIVQIFQNPILNSQNAQLLFNTHDITLLDTTLMRRDQIWFVEKDRAGISRLYSLLVYSPRKDESLVKGYLQGRYGAIPMVDGFYGE